VIEFLHQFGLLGGLCLLMALLAFIALMIDRRARRRDEVLAERDAIIERARASRDIPPMAERLVARRFTRTVRVTPVDDKDLL